MYILFHNLRSSHISITFWHVSCTDSRETCSNPNLTPQAQKVQARATSVLKTLFYLWFHSFKYIFRKAFHSNFFISGPDLLVSFHHTLRKVLSLPQFSRGQGSFHPLTSIRSSFFPLVGSCQKENRGQ